MSKISATALRKEEYQRDQAEISVRGELELAANAILYRYSPKKREQLLRRGHA